MRSIHNDLPFVAREKELSALQDAYQGPHSAFWPIYGRRRVGKSELILQFGKKHPTLYLVGKRAPADQMMREFLEGAAIFLQEPLLASMPVESWKKTIEAVVQRWGKRDKLILVFDEFQWLVEKSPELPSVLQELWDRHWSKSGRMFLILCGSYIGFMEREVLGEKSPLYGRRTGQIFLKPFGYRDAALFHPHVSLAQRAMTYFICGGIPLYLRYFESGRSVLQNIEHVILGEQAALYREPDFLLREELREVEKYYMILMVLASGALPSRDIARRAGIGDRSLHYYLDQLTSLGYIDKRFPLTSQRPKVREVRYRLLDPFLRFWFRFIYPHTSLIAQVGAHRAVTQIIEPELEAYFGLCYESLCRKRCRCFMRGKMFRHYMKWALIGIRRYKSMSLDGGRTDGLISASANGAPSSPWCLRQPSWRRRSGTTRTPKTPPSVAVYSFGRSKGAARNGPKTCGFIPLMSFMSRHLPSRAPRASRTR